MYLVLNNIIHTARHTHHTYELYTFSASDGFAFLVQIRIFVRKRKTKLRPVVGWSFSLCENSANLQVSRLATTQRMLDCDLQVCWMFEKLKRRTNYAKGLDYFVFCLFDNNAKVARSRKFYNCSIVVYVCLLETLFPI